MEPTQPKPIAVWNSARDVWEKPQTEGLFCEHLDVYSETFPTSGMTANGEAYELPTWEPHTDDSGSSYSPPSALLMTPVAAEGTKPSNVMGVARRLTTGQVFLTNQIVTLMGLDPSEKLLPTPEAKLGSSGPDFAKANRPGAGGDDLQTTVARKLLPSPRASEGEKGGPNMRGSKGDLMLSSAVTRLLPTPDASVANDGESTETWLARRERVKLTAANGNGMGMPLTVASLLIQQAPIGASTNPRSDAGKQLWEDVPLPLPKQRDATADTDSAPVSPNG